MSINRGVKRSGPDDESEGDREAQQQELRNKRNKIASDIQRSEAAAAAAAMELDGGEECPHELVLVNRGTNMTIETIKAMLRAVKFVIQTFKITAPEAKEWILQSVSRILIQAKDVVFDPESDKLLDEISKLLHQDIRHLSFAYGCRVIKDESIKMINDLRDNIKRAFNEFIESESRANKFVNQTTSEDPHNGAEMSEVTDGRVGREGNSSETEVDDATRNKPTFAIGRNMRPRMTRKERAAFQRARHMHKINMAAQQRREAEQRQAARMMAEKDYSAESSDSESLGGKRRTRKHKKQMKHKKTKRHRKNTKKHLKKRNNKKQRKTRNRK